MSCGLSRATRTLCDIKYQYTSTKWAWEDWSAPSLSTYQPWYKTILQQQWQDQTYHIVHMYQSHNWPFELENITKNSISNLPKWIKGLGFNFNWQCFFFYLSFWSQLRLHSVMAVAKWHHPSTDWFPINLTLLLSQPPGVRFSCKNEGCIMAQTKHVHHSANKTGRGIVFPGRYPQVAEQPEYLWKHCKSKRSPLMEEAKKVRREREVNKSKHRGIH